MWKSVAAILFLGFGSMASASCPDFSGKYQRTDDKFTFQWAQHSCASMDINEGVWGTVTVQIDGSYRQISAEPAQKAFLFLDGKLVYSYIENDTTETMTIVYTKTVNGGLRGEVSRCNQYSCKKSVDLYNPL